MCLENAKREIDAKVILASKIISRSPETIVVIGNQNIVFKLIMLLRVQSLILIKSAQFYMEKYFKSFKRQHSIIALQDEESIFTMEDEGVVGTNRNYANVLKFVDIVFCWNEKEYSSYGNLAENKKILMTGNPRTEVLRSGDAQNYYQKQIQQIKSQYGDFVLFSSTICQAIPYGELKGLERIELAKITESYSQIEYKRQVAWSRYTHFSLFEFLEFVKHHSECYLNGQTTYNLVVRPHPGDDLVFIRKLFGDLPGVHIDDRYPIAPWLFSANVVLASTCSTLVEAAAAGNVPISYLPKSTLSIRDYLVDLPINNLGLIITDNIQASRLLSKVHNDRKYIVDSLKKDKFRNQRLDSLIGQDDSVSHQVESIRENSCFYVKGFRTKFTLMLLVHLVSFLSILIKAAYALKELVTKWSSSNYSFRNDKFDYLAMERKQIKSRIYDYSKGNVKIKMMNSSILMLSGK